MSNQFGFLTLAIKKDYKKAIALSLRIRELMPGIPIAVVCPSFLHDDLSPFFDSVIAEYPDLRGFEHKLYLDKYSPFEKTFFLDADILMIRAIYNYITDWTGSAYAARGLLLTDGISSFGLDREHALTIIGKSVFASIDGAGHAYFEKPACEPVFNEARKIASSYSVFGAERLADEDVMGISLSKFDIEPKENNGFLGSPWAAVNNSFKIDVNNNFCSYQDALLGKVSPAVIHFPSMGKPLTYAREMRKIFRKNGLTFYSVYFDAGKEYITFKKWVFMKWLRKTFSSQSMK
jgi:hypothetical protein